ncbi:lipoprotein [Spiroplasma endosymbiont of Ammophila pubescens]|uniref:lipoprotein n=1 Tax=Spiroplasma endosymbiont of Ammophila pubescens TaxID=3066315 RepID=UPI0032B1177D
MKKILSLLGTITLIGTSTTNLVACNKTQYSEDDLKKEKEKHKIDTANQEIKNNLEWIAPQETPFNQIDNKYYFVVWRGDENTNWRIIKFKNINFSERRKVLDTQEDYELALTRLGDNLFRVKIGAVRPITSWSQDDGTYFKSVYRWKIDKNIPRLEVNDKTGEIKVERE